MKSGRLPPSWVMPDWPVKNVRAFTTTRQAPDAETPELKHQNYQAFNLALHVNDCTEAVLNNRAKLASLCSLKPDHIHWLEQVHSNRLVQAEHVSSMTKADASFTRCRKQACVVMTADCLPVLFCNRQATQVAAAHAGWRGLASGVLSNTLKSFGSSKEVVAWLGPAISQKVFEVGEDVYAAFCAKHPEATQAFIPRAKKGKWLANLYQLARLELSARGVTEIYGGERCTYLEEQNFYSYRRDGQCSGRMASMIYLP